jgi:hypothetical protein
MTPKVRNKLWSSVGNNGLRKSVETEDLLDEKVGSLSGVNGFRARKEMSHLRETIFDDKDGV